MSYALRATEKPRYAKKNSDNYCWRDRGRQDCEGIDNATKFASYEDAVQKCAEFGGAYEVEEL